MSYISEIRKFVGHAPIMVIAATGIIYSKEKGLLLEKRTDTGEWCTPGGSIELGEALTDALKREIKEETNLDFKSAKLFDVKDNVHMIYPNGDEVYYTDFVYEIKDFYGDLRHDGESTELRFFDIKSLPENIMPTQIDYIEKFVATKLG